MLQAIDLTVFIALLPIFIGVGLVLNLVWPYLSESYHRAFAEAEPREERAENHGHVPAAGADPEECEICWSMRKRYKIYATCGHSFCGKCLLRLYSQQDDRINCPVCHLPIVLMIRSFDSREGYADERNRIEGRINEYNRRFDDARPFFRRMGELPRLTWILRRHMFSFRYFYLFTCSVYSLRLGFFILIYFMLPFDLMPESTFGYAGYLDDLVISILVMVFSYAAFSAIVLRRGR